MTTIDVHPDTTLAQLDRAAREYGLRLQWDAEQRAIVLVSRDGMTAFRLRMRRAA